MDAHDASSTTFRRIPVTVPSFDEAEERMVCEAIRSGWVTQGPKVAEFESGVASYVGAECGVAVTSATTALFLSLHGYGIGAGDEVIVPSLSFIASANSIVHCGAAPVFVDVDPRTYTIDPDLIEAAITSRTRAIMPVDQLGMPVDADRINAIAARHNLWVIQDAACAIGSVYKGKPVGAHADLSCFSFHPRKVLVTGEGGMIVTNNKDLAERLRRLRHQGMSLSDLQRHRADRVVTENYSEIGYNFRLSDVLAAMGIAQLAKLPDLLAKRRQAAARYAEALAPTEEIELPAVPDYAEPNHQSYIVRWRGATRSQRNALLDELQRRGVSTRRGLMAIHQERCYQGARICGSLQRTEEAADQTLILPMYAGLSEEDQAYVVHNLHEALATIPRESAPRVPAEGGTT